MSPKSVVESRVLVIRYIRQRIRAGVYHGFQSVFASVFISEYHNCSSASTYRLSRHPCTMLRRTRCLRAENVPSQSDILGNGALWMRYARFLTVTEHKGGESYSKILQPSAASSILHRFLNKPPPHLAHFQLIFPLRRRRHLTSTLLRWQNSCLIAETTFCGSTYLPQQEQSSSYCFSSACAVLTAGKHTEPRHGSASLSASAVSVRGVSCLIQNFPGIYFTDTRT